MVLAEGGPSGMAEPLLAAILLSSIVASVPLAAFAMLSYRRRRSTPYLFVAIGFVLFLLKSVVGGATILSGVSTELHHFLEHGFDFLIAAFLLAAVYVSRRANTLDVFAVDDPKD
jgi:hypothetical protein